ncbi:MAG: F0F1 ATP synthase subunit epsilon [Vicinamibacteria bacterium]|jgi:F-type H+-transporting ATPase subunit epsilon|nr:F0F1 ATP synthase subunit epsilon [Vicinamibacteria bacterium]
MSETTLPTKLKLEIVTPEGLLLRDEVESVTAPGSQGSFGVLPGHTPFLCTLGVGEIIYRKDGHDHALSCFWGFCEVLSDRVSILAEIGERAEDIDAARAETAMKNATERLKAIRGEEGFAEAHLAYQRAVTRLAVAGKRRI